MECLTWISLSFSNRWFFCRDSLHCSRWVGNIDFCGVLGCGDCESKKTSSQSCISSLLVLYSCWIDVGILFCVCLASQCRHNSFLSFTILVVGCGIHNSIWVWKKREEIYPCQALSLSAESFLSFQTAHSLWKHSESTDYSTKRVLNDSSSQIGMLQRTWLLLWESKSSFPFSIRPL